MQNDMQNDVQNDMQYYIMIHVYTPPTTSCLDET